MGYPRPASLYRMVFRAPDLNVARAFYTDVWGLIDEGTIDGAVALRSPGADHCDLFLREGGGGVESIGLALRAPEHMATLIDRARATGATLFRPPGDDPLGEAASARLQTRDGTNVELILPAPPSPDRRPVPGAQPEKIGHVVLWSTDRASAEQFYQALGFEISDRTALGMSFMRCNGDHHSLAIADGNHEGLQHLAFEVGTIDDVMIARGRLDRAGTKCLWGVGRHGPGRTVFSYYLDPAGNTIEFCAEVEQYDDCDDALTPIFWGKEHKGDTWQIAGPSPFAPK